MRTTLEQYLRHLQALMPRGRAWPTEDGAALTQLLAGFSGGLSRNHNRAVDLIDEADPRTTIELLGEWERICGLPDGCSASGAATLAERRDAVVAKITGRGGQSRQYFIDLAGALGYAVSITEHGPFLAGISTAGDPVNIEAWRFVFTVHAATATVRDFRAGASAAGEPLRTWGNTALECAITANKPAHTNVIFAYGG